MTAVAQGDRGALSELYRRHASWLLLRLQRRCGDPGLAEDVLQDIFVAVWKNAGTYSGRGEVAASLWGIGIRRLIDRLRRSRDLRPLPERSRGGPPRASSCHR